MAISFITNALGATNSTTTFSISLPTTQAGDILILEFTHRGTADGTIGGTSVTTGGLTWNLKHSQLYAASAFSGKTYWTRATGDHSGQTVTGTGLTNSCAAIVTQYRGALASGDPLADATIVGEQNASGDEGQAAITTATNGAWVVLVVANSPDVAVTSQASENLTITARAERLSTGGTDTSIAHASGELATAGSSGAFTWAQTNGASGSWAYAITPAPVITEGEGASDGLATVEATGASIAAADGASEGVATSEAVGEGVPAESTVEGVGASDGAATAEATGESTAEAVAAADGAGDAQAEGAAIAEAVGESASVATVEATGESFGTIEAVGSSEASSTAQAVGEDAAEPVDPPIPNANCYFDGQYHDGYFEACRPAGGWLAHNQAVIDRLERERRKRDEEEDLADRLEVELAKEGLVPPNPAAEVRIHVREYPPIKRRTQRAVDYAQKAKTELAYQLALREIAREQEEEEYALLLALAAA